GDAVGPVRGAESRGAGVAPGVCRRRFYGAARHVDAGPGGQRRVAARRQAASTRAARPAGDGASERARVLAHLPAERAAAVRRAAALVPLQDRQGPRLGWSGALIAERRRLLVGGLVAPKLWRTVPSPLSLSQSRS